jgi:hypothetical protein
MMFYTKKNSTMALGNMWSLRWQQSSIKYFVDVGGGYQSMTQSIDLVSLTIGEKMSS